MAQASEAENTAIPQTRSVNAKAGRHSPGLCIQCASFDSLYVKGVPNRALNCAKSRAALVLREVFCPELVIFPKTGVQIGNTGGFLLPSTSGRGGHKKRWPVSEPLQLFRESLPLPCFPCASFLFKSDLYSPSIAGSASKAAPCLPSRWPFRHAPRCGVERSEYSERESLSWGAGKGRGSLFILTGISLISSFIEYI